MGTWSPREGTQVIERDDTLQIDYSRMGGEHNDPWDRQLVCTRYDEGDRIVNIRMVIEAPGDNPRSVGVSLGKPELLALRDWVERMLGKDYERPFNELRDRLRHQHEGGVSAGGDET